VEGAHLINQPVDAPLDAELTIIAFRAGPAESGGKPAFSQ
jgi:hypothetical protein